MTLRFALISSKRFNFETFFFFVCLFWEMTAWGEGRKLESLKIKVWDYFTSESAMLVFLFLFLFFTTASLQPQRDWWQKHNGHVEHAVDPTASSHCIIGPVQSDFTYLVPSFNLVLTPLRTGRVHFVAFSFSLDFTQTISRIKKKK